MPTLPSQPRAPLSWPASKAANGATGERTECSMSARPYPKPPETQKPVQGVAYGMGAAIGAFAAMSAARAGAVNAATAARASSAFFISIPSFKCVRPDRRQGGNSEESQRMFEDYSRFDRECCGQPATLAGKRPYGSSNSRGRAKSANNAAQLHKKAPDNAGAFE